MARTVSLAEKLGKTPVVVNDYPGFVANRILLPMINEAVYALQEGVAERDAIDTIMKLGMGHPMGPLQLADLIGLDVCLVHHGGAAPGSGGQQVPPLPAAAQDGRRRAPRPQERPRFLRLRLSAPQGSAPCAHAV